MKHPKFSIVTVCYNAGDKLYNTINTALAQTYDNFEIIVKDGMSKDDSLSKVLADARIKVIQTPDKGIYDAMNQALEHITGDYVYFLNCGDSFYNERGYCKRMQSILKKYRRLPVTAVFPAIKPAFMKKGCLKKEAMI